MHDAVDQRRQPFQGIPLFIKVFVPVIDPLNSGDRMSQHALRDIRPNTSAPHQCLGGWGAHPPAKAEGGGPPAPATMWQGGRRPPPNLMGAGGVWPATL